MFQSLDVYDESKGIIGSCSDELLFRWQSDAIELVVNKGSFESWKGWLDICVTNGNCITLPREVQTVLAVNIGGKPTLGKDQLFNFHLNGPGDCCTGCEYSWQDLGANHSTYRDLPGPSKLVAYLSRAEDNGTELVVFGYAENGDRLRRLINGVWMDGILIPTIYGYAIPDANAPKIARIDGIYKETSVGTIRLSTIDDSGATGLLLALYEPDENLPQYRRIKLNRKCDWFRVAYRKTIRKITSRADRIPMASRFAFLLSLRACKFYNEQDFASAHSYEADATRIELEAQDALTPPTYMPPQILDWNNLQNKNDFDIL